MIRFDLEKVKSGANWWSVTIGMAPDEISYEIVINDIKVQRCDPLTRLFALYARARTSTSAPEEGGLEPFRVVQTNCDDKIQVYVEGVPHETSHNELRSAMEPFLASVFTILDERNDGEERKQGLVFVSNEVGIDATEVYRELS